MDKIRKDLEINKRFLDKDFIGSDTEYRDEIERYDPDGTYLDFCHEKSSYHEYSADNYCTSDPIAIEIEKEMSKSFKDPNYLDDEGWKKYWNSIQCNPKDKMFSIGNFGFTLCEMRAAKDRLTPQFPQSLNKSEK